MSTYPPISVFVPAYRHAGYITQTLDSLLGQTRPPQHILVIDDGSGDNTTQIVQPYLEKIEYIEHPNRGIHATFNEGLTGCHADYMLLIAADDWLYPDALAQMAAVLDQNPNVGLVFGGVTVVDGQGAPTAELGVAMPYQGKHRKTADLIAQNYVYAPTALCRKTALDDAGPFLDFTYAQDWAMWLNIALCGWSLYGLDRPLAYYRRHATNLTHDSRTLAALDNEIAMLRYIQQSHTLTVDENAAVERAVHHRLRKIGWTALERKEPRIARTSFGRALRYKADIVTSAGLALSYAPDRLYRGARALNRSVITKLRPTS